MDNGLDVDSTKEVLGGEDYSTLYSMLLNMSTNKCTNLNDYGVYLNHLTNYSEILLSSIWRFEKLPSKAQGY